MAIMIHITNDIQHSLSYVCHLIGFLWKDFNLPLIILCIIHIITDMHTRFWDIIRLSKKLADYEREKTKQMVANWHFWQVFWTIIDLSLILTKLQCFIWPIINTLNFQGYFKLMMLFKVRLSMTIWHISL